MNKGIPSSIALGVVVVLVIIVGGVFWMQNEKGNKANNGLTGNYQEDDKVESINNALISDRKANKTIGLGMGIVDTGQSQCFGATGEIACPEAGHDYYGQDAQYMSLAQNYTDNTDGTITDGVTALMWQKSVGDKVTFEEGMNGADNFNLAGYSDWRVPTIKEMYSLMNFNGNTGSGNHGGGTAPNDALPYIDTNYFDFKYGDASAGDRYIDAQWMTSSEYVSTTMDGDKTVFGVNFADGRIKGYGYSNPNKPGREKKFYIRYVRGASYGNNQFINNSNGTITDKSSGLIWQKGDSAKGMVWKDALEYCEDLDLAGDDDWRLPNVKELQYIVDYSRSPSTTDSAALDPIFSISAITDEGGSLNYPFFWTSTTHKEGSSPGSNAAYVAFGEALGFMQFGNSSSHTLVDVHGAGAQRSDPKIGDPNNYPNGHGPQGDVIRIYNHARCARGQARLLSSDEISSLDRGSYPANADLMDVIPNTSSSQQKPKQQDNDKLPAPQGTAPPQEALAACASKSAGDSCSFNSPQSLVSGTCRAVDNQLACVPSNNLPPRN